MKIKYRMLGNPVLETMDRIDQLVLDLHYENMFLDYLCNKMQDAMNEENKIEIEIRGGIK